ncbi:sulfatase [Thermostilla marina]
MIRSIRPGTGIAVLGFVALSLAAAFVPETQAANGTPDRWNVLFLAVDDLRPQLGCYGDPLVKSPNIDRLAADGMVFDRAYCQQALCSPSRISLLSGRHPATTQIYTIGPPLRSTMPDIVTLPQLFKNHGWFTCSLGKVYHVGIDDPASWSIPSWQSPKPRYGPVGMAAVRARREALKKAGKPIPTRGPENPFYAGPAFEAVDCDDADLTDGDIAREAVERLRKLAAEKQPFFLAVGFHNPHVPWVSPKKYWDLYDPDEIVLPDNRYPPRNAPDFAASSGADFYWYGNTPEDRNVTPEFGRQCLHGYLAAISYIDAQVGKVVAELERLGLRDKTIIVLWGDHGYYMGEHNWWGGKHNNYEGATRAPLIVSVPGMKAAGKHTSALVEFVDIYPTLADLAGLPTPEGVEGKSFKPLLNDPDRPWKRAAFSEYPKRGYKGTAMRTDRYRFVVWLDKQGNVVARELYDHQVDPQENENVAAKPEYASIVAELEAEWRANWPPAKSEQ